MLLLGTVDPDWGGVVHSDFEDNRVLSLGRHEAGEDASIRLDGHTWIGEGRLNDGVVLGEVVEVDLVAWGGSHDVRREDEAILTDGDVDSLC